MLILAACTDSKTVRPEPELLMRAYSGPAADVARRWTKSIRYAEHRVAASSLYKGGYWAAIREVAQQAARSEVLVVSAGLGLIRFDDEIPSYSATFSAGHADSVPGAAAVHGRQAWWSALGGPARLQKATQGVRRPALICAVPNTYLRAIEPALESVVGRLAEDRFVVLGTPASERLQPFSIPIDARATRTVGGTAGQVTARILAWLTTTGQLSGRWVYGSVADAVAGLTAVSDPALYPQRRHCTDREVRAWIAKRWRSQSPPTSATQALRRFRQDGWACEQSRFGALYQEVTRTRGGSQ